jgi:putative transposase
MKNGNVFSSDQTGSVKRELRHESSASDSPQPNTRPGSLLSQGVRSRPTCLQLGFGTLKAYRAEGKRVKMKDLKAEYNRIKKEQFPWCYEVTKCAPEQEFSHLGQAFENYWRMKEEGTLPKLNHPRKDGEEGGFPRFKSKKRERRSFYLSEEAGRPFRE